MNSILPPRKAKAQHSHDAAAKYLRQNKQKEALMWVNWILLFGILVALSAASIALKWPVLVKGVLILINGVFGVLIVLLIMLAFDKGAIK